MILLIDIGNSRLKWATASGKRLRPGEAWPHHGSPEKLIRRLPHSDVTEVWVSQVLGSSCANSMTRSARSRFKMTPTFARVRREFMGLRIAYTHPTRLGVDRWLSMLGIWKRSGKPFCVASAGTALTFDAVDARGRHLGGLIAPGLQTTEQAVLGATRIPVGRSDADYGKGLGRDTETCVRQGALHAAVGLIDRAAKPVRGSRFLSGGDASVLRAQLAGRWTIREHLVLEGLLALATHE